MQIITKDFHGSNLRIILIDGKEHFIAKDVALLLGYKRTADAISQHCKKPQAFGTFEGVGKTPTLDPQTKIIPESDVWRLIVKSKMPEAEKIEEWIMEEVLPSIRKTGSYSTLETKPIPKTQLQELQETLDFIDIFDKFSEKTKGKSKIELLKLDDFLTKSGKKSVLDILNIDLKNSYFSVSELGNLTDKKGSEINQDLAKIGFQIQKDGVWEVLENGENFCFETKNRFSQLKWKFEVLEKIEVELNFVNSIPAI